MTILLFTGILFVGSLAAGLLGSLTGLGGGVVIIPLLTLVFRVDIHYAIGTSLISVIATSSGAAAAYVREGITNIRLGMFLELATTAGAIAGAWLATYLPTSVIAILFGAILIISAGLSFAKRADPVTTGAPGALSVKLRLNSSMPTPNGPRPYFVKNIVGGFVMMNIAGMI